MGFIGLGIMGKGMAANLLKKVDGCSLVVWNRSPDACNELSAAFPGKVTIASTAAEVVQKCTVTYSMLSTMEASEAVFDCPDGVIAAITPGKCIVDCATLSPERMVAIESGVTTKGGQFLEAPVSGSKVPAETGTLIFLCGGSPELYEKATPALQAMGKANFLFGEVGAGSKMKLVVNMIMGTMMSAFAEGMFQLQPRCLFLIPPIMHSNTLISVQAWHYAQQPTCRKISFCRCWTSARWPTPCSKGKART